MLDKQKYKNRYVKNLFKKILYKIKLKKTSMNIMRFRDALT